MANKTSTARELVIYIQHPENYVTSDSLTMSEYTEVISIRAAQIEKGGKVYTDVTGISDPIEKAKKEIKDKKCPLSVRRVIRKTEPITVEDRSVNDLAIPQF